MHPRSRRFEPSAAAENVLFRKDVGETMWTSENQYRSAPSQKTAPTVIPEQQRSEPTSAVGGAGSPWPTAVWAGGAFALSSSFLVERGTVEASVVGAAVLFTVLLLATVTDLRSRRIPNPLVTFGAVAGVGRVLLPFGAAESLPALLSAAAGGLAFAFAVREGSRLLFGRPGLGMGDVKLVGIMGLLVGWGALWIFYLAAFLSGLFGAVGLAAGAFDRTAHLPLAPFLAVAAMLHGAGFSASWFAEQVVLAFPILF